MTENWRPVVGYAGFYEVSDLGNVRSLDRVDARGMLRKGRVLKSRVDTKGAGYRYTNLSLCGVPTKVNVHVLVLEAFIGLRPSDRHDACHDDGRRDNPALGNLRWDTKAGNWTDKWRHGTATAGEKNKRAVLTAELVEWVRDSRQSSLQLAPILGVASSTIRAVRLGQNWSHQNHLIERGYAQEQTITA